MLTSYGAGGYRFFFFAGAGVSGCIPVVTLARTLFKRFFGRHFLISVIPNPPICG
jgi:hypothetical protein